jgi:hypothetical protein
VRAAIQASDEPGTVLAGAPSALIPGNNIFFGHGRSAMLVRAASRAAKATVLGHHGADWECCGWWPTAPTAR